MTPLRQRMIEDMNSRCVSRDNLFWVNPNLGLDLV